MLMLRPSANMARMAGTPSAVAGIFTYRLGSSTSSWKWRAAVIVPVGVVRQAGCHLQRHESVDAVRGVVDRSEHGQRVADVGDDELPVGLFDGVGREQLAELLVVVVPALDGLGEDGGVRRHAPDALVDQCSASRPPRT